MIVLIADKFEQTGIDALRAAGMRVRVEPGLEDAALAAGVAESGCEVLVVRSTKVTGPVLAASPLLSLVVRAGAGYNTIDVGAASARSIPVANCPGKNSIAVAELTFALILALDRRVVDNAVDLRRGVWNKKEYSKAGGLKGRTLGIVGMGDIGHAVAARARAFEMRVVAWSRSLTDEAAAACDVERCGSVAEVADQSDILTVHLAATAETKHVINADVLNRLKPGSFVINTARAEVVDYRALADAMKSRQLRVGLDVYPDEPSAGTGTFADAIVKCEGVVYGTHHIGASTEQAQDAIAAETVRIIVTFAKTGRVLNCVNVRQPGADGWTLRVRHENKPGVLAHVLRELSLDGINVEEMENVIMAGETGACAHIRLDAKPRADTIERIRSGSGSILAVSCTSASA
ncbi:MAG: hydroxyacid dehydrogenase [Phycisphaerales bacterium]|nr:hydroxyacid dehydrogenase [Phycisphaerales bacterium]